MRREVRYNLSLEGSISKTKILKLYEFMSMMDGKTKNYDGTGLVKVIPYSVQMAG